MQDPYKENTKNTADQELWRYRVVGLFLFVAGVMIIGRVLMIQGSEWGEGISDWGEKFQGYTVNMLPPRGQIYDRQGRLLAGNEKVYQVGINLVYVDWGRSKDEELRDARAIATTLSYLLDLPYEDVLRAANIPYNQDAAVYVAVKSFVSYEEVQKIDAFIEDYQEEHNGKDDPHLWAITWRPQLGRSYPEKSLASGILGFVSQRDGKGYYGIEQQYDVQLTGFAQEVYIPNDPNQVEDLPDIPPGSSLILTIDREIQFMAEQELQKALETFKAKSGTVIIMEPRTGEILAMTSTPTMNLNEYWTLNDTFPDDSSFNRAVMSIYEPGSVFKILTMAIGIDSGEITPETEYTDVGYSKVFGGAVYNWNNSVWGTVDMIGCLQHSINTCHSWIVEQLTIDTFVDYLDDFGIGHYTGVDLAEEISGRLKTPGDSDWSDADAGKMAYGQAVSVTPLQLLMAVNAIANQGHMVVPHVVKSTLYNGNPYDVPVQFAGQPVSAETAHTINEMLTLSLEIEGSKALVPGYRIAGKTGTAEIPGAEGYDNELTNTSFIGWGPVDDPQFIVYVWLEEPEENIWSSNTAAPTFKEIVQRLVLLLDIPPDYQRQAMTSELSD